jgi:nitroimidazol reductase NimA-like FMN-containing flavoprotein (pyridoxamine 5'-phosphate oxidase superfamily)
LLPDKKENMMRRKDREITDIKEIEKILESAFVCHLGLVDGDMPYVVPVNYMYKDGFMYLHGASSGRKLDIIAKNPNACFEVEITPGTVIENGDQPCDWGTRFRSVIGWGKAEILQSNEEKIEALHIFMSRFSGSKFKFPEGEVMATTVVRIKIDNMTGKKANE